MQSSNRLPNEVLIRILQFACTVDGKLKPVQDTKRNPDVRYRLYHGASRFRCQLPFVSRLFRDIILKQNLIYQMNHFYVDNFDTLRLFMRTTPRGQLGKIRTLEFKSLEYNMAANEDVIRLWTGPPSVYQDFMAFKNLDHLILDFHDTIYFAKGLCHKLMKRRFYQECLRVMNVKKVEIKYASLKEAKSRNNGIVVWSDSEEPVEEDDMKEVEKEVQDMLEDLHGK